MPRYFCKECGDEIEDVADRVVVPDESRPNGLTYYHRDCAPDEPKIDVDEAAAKLEYRKKMDRLLSQEMQSYKEENDPTKEQLEAFLMGIQTGIAINVEAQGAMADRMAEDLPE